MSRSESKRLPVLPEALKADYLALAGRVAGVLERGLSVPCHEPQTVPVGWWTSEEHHEQRLAAESCQRCPLQLPCRRYGIGHPKEAGVYGGLTERERAEVARVKTTRNGRSKHGDEDLHIQA